MTRKIYKAICIASLIVFAVTMALSLVGLYNYFSGLQQNQLKNETALAALGVEQLGQEYLDGLKEEDYRISWIAGDGTVLYDNASDSQLMENHLEREEIKQALESGWGSSSRYSNTLMERYLYCAQRLSDGTVLRLSVAHGSILLLLLGLMQPILIIILIAAIISFVLANRLSKKIVEPMNSLNLDEPLENEGYPELAPMFRRLHNQQSRLKMSEQQRREFTANVSHELKTPLQTISGYSELLKCGMVEPDKVQPFSEKIYSEAQRLIVLVQDIINLSHMDEGGEDLQWSSVSLKTCVDQAFENLSELARQNEITLSCEGEDCEIYAVPELVSDIIFNLCENAVKYNHPGGAVCVTLDNKSVRVKDNGIGIPEEHLDRIFERFYRVDKSHSKEVGGTGLGLSIVKHAARILDAEIELSSKQGEGTEVLVTFK